MGPSTPAVRRLVRRLGGQVLRRLGMIPEGIPDGLGEDRALAGSRLTQQVMVFFPDTPTNLYQLRQWYEPLRALHQTHAVVIVVQDSRVARSVRAEADLPVITVGRSATLDELIANSELKLALYVSHLPGNFLALRHTSLVHVYLGHGDSDKEVSASNQIKAYDFCFVAGQAAVDRIKTGPILFEPDRHLVRVGRPQLDTLSATPPGPESDRRTVLYAPTWEGAQPSVAYGSVVSHGMALVDALLRSGRFRVIYRPHPRSGANDASYGEADAAIRRRVEQAMTENSESGHRVDTAAEPVPAMRAADLLITDISAVALDWLPSGKPLIVTIPEAPTARVAATRLLDAVPRLAAADAENGAELVATALADDPDADRRRELVEYYFDDPTPGTATRRFVDACAELIALRDKEISARTTRSVDASPGSARPGEDT